MIHGMKTLATGNYDFERLITDGYAYVDKTDMLWNLAIADLKGEGNRESPSSISYPNRL